MYGSNTGRIRAELTYLLRQQRNADSRVSDDWLAASPNISKYRQSVLAWSRQAVRSASSSLIWTGSASKSRGPVEELIHRLDHAITTSTSGTAGLDDLAKNQRTDMARAWQRAAQAAALGEHDFGAGVNYVSLEDQQRMTVLKDASEIVHALVILDANYAAHPDWEQLADADSLGRAAVVCAAYAGYGGVDHSVDAVGWHRRPTAIPGKALHGVDGVLQAQYNVAVDLADHFPNALNLRRVINFQREMSEQLAGRLGSNPSWADRAATLRTLEQEARNLGGQIGSGGTAAAESSNVVGRLSRLPKDAAFARGQEQRLGRLAEHVDSLLAAAIVHGANERLYFLRTKVPRLDGHSDHLVHGVRHKYVPVQRVTSSQFLEIARSQLSPPVREPVRRARPQAERLMFQAELEQRPAQGPALGM